MPETEDCTAPVVPFIACELPGERLWPLAEAEPRLRGLALRLQASRIALTRRDHDRLGRTKGGDFHTVHINVISR